MFFWKFNVGQNGAFVDELGKIAALDVDALIKLEYPGYDVIETLTSGEYMQCTCEHFIYRYTYKIMREAGPHIMYVELDIGEETGQVDFTIYNERDFHEKYGR